MPIQERYIDSDGNFTDGTLTISTQNRAFRYGDGVFETILVSEGKALALGLHFSRFEIGLASLWIDTGYPHFRPKVEALVEKLLKDQPVDGFGRMRISGYRSDGGTYLPTDNRVQLLGEVIPLPADPWLLRQPMRVALGSAPQRGSLYEAKALNALYYIIEARKAQQFGYDDALLRSSSNQLTELTASNVFAVRDGRLLTPALTSGCLPGTMRARVLIAAQNLGIEIVESAIQVTEVKYFSECFASNAIMGLQPIGEITEIGFPTNSFSNFPVMMQLREYLLATRGMQLRNP